MTNRLTELISLDDYRSESLRTILVLVSTSAKIDENLFIGQLIENGNLFDEIFKVSVDFGRLKVFLDSKHRQATRALGSTGTGDFDDSVELSQIRGGLSYSTHNSSRTSTPTSSACQLWTTTWRYLWVFTKSSEKTKKDLQGYSQVIGRIFHEQNQRHQNECSQSQTSGILNWVNCRMKFTYFSWATFSRPTRTSLCRISSGFFDEKSLTIPASTNVSYWPCTR